MKKVTYGVPFEDANRRKIENVIRATFRAYMQKNERGSLSRKDREHLMGQSKDQLTMYIQDLARSNEAWSMAHNEIPFVVMSENGVRRKSLLSVMGEDVEENTFYRVKNFWYLGRDDNFEMLNSEEFANEIYREIYEGAETAALYAIDSLFSVRERYHVE